MALGQAGTAYSSGGGTFLHPPGRSNGVHGKGSRERGSSENLQQPP